MAKIPRSKNNKHGAACREAIETAGEVFSDGTTLELIRLDSGAEAMSLLRWESSKAAVGQEFKVNGKIYRPLRMNFTSPRAVRLPGHNAPYGSTRDLFNDVCRVLTQYTDLAENHIWQTAYFILGSWLADRLLVAPFLSVIAPLGTAKAQFLRLLSSFCRRPLMLAEVTPAAISRFASLRPTMLFDEPVLSRRAARLLFATNNYHDFALGNGRVMDAFTAKALFSLEPLGDALLASQALEITLSLAGRQVPFLEDSARERIADEFQSKLLHYRLANIGTIRTPRVDVTELTVPMQDVARALGACFPDDEELQRGVIQLLRERDQDAYQDSSSELGSAIMEGLLFCCHCEKRSQVLCGELADIVNAIWGKRGEGRQTTPESVGWKLRGLDLRTEPIDGVGKGLRLTEAVRARIHSLAQALKVPSLRQTIQAECLHCKLAYGKQ